MSIKPFVGGNWKCNGTKASVTDLCAKLVAGPLPPAEVCDIVVAPPHIFIDFALGKLAGSAVRVSAQDCNARGNGAFTGSHSPEMLKEFGLQYVIIGHSERRDIFHESNQEVCDKVRKAQQVGLSVIACLGEHLEDRKAGKTNEVIFEQMRAIAQGVVDWTKIVIAYEPVWAIGTGVVASPEQAQEAHAALRQWISEHVSPEVAHSTRIIYGGSVTGANCQALSRQPDVNGFLVGGASLKPEFLQICNTIAQEKHH